MAHRQTENMYNRLMELQRELPALTPCTTSPESYFPEDIPDPTLAELATEIAKNLCLDCPIMMKCRDYAIQARPHYGIWGGLTVAERNIN